MSLSKLLEDAAIVAVRVEPAEIAGLVRLAQRDLRTAAAIMDADLDWAFAVAYNGILQCSVAYMAVRGYRPRSRNKHLVTFEFMAAALPEEEMTARLQRLRRKRNATVYDCAGLVGESEAREMIEYAEGFLRTVIGLMPTEVTSLLEEDA